MKYALIDYGDGDIAELWGSFTGEDVELFFERHARQCFGIRKSISDFILLGMRESSLPEPWASMAGAATVLKHSGDVIVWNAAGEKIKSEWD